MARPRQGDASRQRSPRTKASADPLPASGEQGIRLSAGVGRRDITDYGAGPVNDPLYVKAIILEYAGQRLLIATVDAVAL